MADMGRRRLAGREDDLAALTERTEGALTIAEIAPEARLDLRVDPAIAADRRLRVPLEPNTVLRDDHRAALWLGPDEWLVVGPPDQVEAIREELGAALAGLHRSIVDVSANHTAIDLGGVAARDALASGCSLDLHAARWQAGMCAQTLFARAPVILEQLDERTTRIYVRPSFADYVVDRLAAGV